MRLSGSITAAAAAITAASFVSGANTPGVVSKLKVHVPRSLAKDGGYDHREAFFGIPSYVASLQQDLYYADSDLCHPKVDTHAGYPVRPNGSTGRMLPWPSPFILMVDRGECTFVTQVRNAQHAGAAGVIVADNRCLCETVGRSCTPDPRWSCEPVAPVMGGDGSGGDVTIPSFLVFKQDADPIKAELKQNRTVRIEMSWSLPAPDARVEYDLWTTPSDKTSRDFLLRFKEAAVALGERAYFTPYMNIRDGIQWRCQGNDVHEKCHTRCTNNMRYCASAPRESPTSGADVVRESLRRLCAWNLYGKDDGVGVEWWDYIQEFSDRCDNDDYYADEQCVRNAMRHAKMDYSMVQNCMSDSGGLEGDVKNTVLEEQLAAKKSSGALIFPAVYVNRAPLRGSLGFEFVFKAICGGYAPGTAPKVCGVCAYCADPMACVQGDHKSCAGSARINASGGRGTSPLMVLFVVVVVAMVGGLSVQHFQRKRNAEMRDHVRGVLAQYMPLEGESGSVGSPMDLTMKSAGATCVVPERY